jgi:hypothetical protein
MAIDDELERMRAARIPREKKKRQPIAKKSKKKLAQESEEKKLLSSDGDSFKEKWFKARRREMVGVCQCGCAEPSSKNDDVNFRSSAAHIFPKGLFPSVMYHPLNWVERRFWAGKTGASACHTMMDEAGLDRWPVMADWLDIRERFFILSAELTPEEKATKFYSKLEKLVYANP